MQPPIWYDVLLTLLKPLYVWRIRQRAENSNGLQLEMSQRFGPFLAPKNTQAIWFHAVSVGETNAAQPLVEHYLKQGFPVLLTNTTKTGQARAKTLFEQQYPDLFQAVFLPVDQKKKIKAFVRLYQPKILLLMETELWANLLANVPTPKLLLNARLSEKSANGYAKIKSLTRPMLHSLDWIATQDQATFERFKQLGKNPKQMSIVGNIKFDIHAPQSFLDEAERLKTLWQLQHRKIIVFASTHAPEEQQLLVTLKSALMQDPNLLCIVVPRHPERFDAVFEIAQQLELKTHRRSLKQEITTDTQVYLADSMGELWLWYALAHVAFVGGSLNTPGGGHNILEPISLGVPTIVGKNYFNFQAIVDYFMAEDAVKIAQDVQDVVHKILQLVDNPTERLLIAQKAKDIMQNNKGSLKQHTQLIDRFLI
ncbi:3-deoxy-D-manno-octulosonic acid transferase [Acinetobacter sp. HY1485]|uniref:3-deoxy-D-manno-octulosonic acid transferase n=1 Tax=Acinetobacter sp. HY1485 TaxID=2970918 RepID=UPI0022B9A9DA|nr:3-deoxy-D-manno-octulosonic acid transferase [Acinetobacter sp. HY1485]